MPDRTKEELEQIRKDFIAIKKVWDEEIEKIPTSYPNPFNNKSRKEEIENYKVQTNRPLQDLLSSGKLKSCEALTLIEKTIAHSEAFYQNPPWWVRNIGVSIEGSSRIKVVKGSNVSLDKMVEMLETLLHNDSKLNKILDMVGTSACAPRASINPHQNSVSSKYRA